jgi:tetraacyldisaccharide 4'-kinase
MLKAPKFWYLKKDTILSRSLYPLSLLFRLGTKLRNIISRTHKFSFPIICIGNIVVGGAGKTPVAIKIGGLLKLAGYNPHFISKGYAGVIKRSTLIESWHSPKSVGDEPLLLSTIAPTWIGEDRVNSIRLAKNMGADCIIMDDGFQNPTIHKDFSIIVINASQEFGNTRVMPAGPLRESIKSGLSRTNLIIVIGEITNNLQKNIPDHIPVIQAKFKINNENKIFKGQKITAFAGIAYPEKFFTSLREQGAKIIKEVTYPDHHIYDENDLLNLAETANKTQSILVSTQKDFVRIPKPYRSLVNTLEGKIFFEKEDIIKEILTNIIENNIENAK